MNWEKLTSPEFKAAAAETSVCIIAFGVLERHGDHLPLGTDYLNSHKLATRAAELEKAVVFPPFYFGQIYEARCFPGTVTISPTLLYQLIQEVMDEIGRNGFRKIILLNGHGGNNGLLRFLVQAQLWAEKPYVVYWYQPSCPEREELYRKVCDTDVHGHACECETSISLYNQELVKMEAIPEGTRYRKDAGAFAEEFSAYRGMAIIPSTMSATLPRRRRKKAIAHAKRSRTVRGIYRGRKEGRGLTAVKRGIPNKSRNL